MTKRTPNNRTRQRHDGPEALRTVIPRVLARWRAEVEADARRPGSCDPLDVAAQWAASADEMRRDGFTDSAGERAARVAEMLDGSGLLDHYLPDEPAPARDSGTVRLRIAAGATNYARRLRR